MKYQLIIGGIKILENEILREIGALARCIQSISDIRYREIKLQRGQFIFLTRVCEQPGINLIELSDLLKVDKATTTKAIQKLMKQEYVLREHDPKDGRMWRLYPSSKAQQVYSDIIQEENSNIEVCFAGFSSQERAFVYQLVKQMRQNIEREWKELKT